MADVFLLGAGFSKAVDPSMPLLQEVSSELRSRVPELPPNVTSLGENVELWLTYLSQRQPWKNEAENLRNRALFLDLTRRIGDILNERTQQTIRQTQRPPDWLRRLLTWWDAQQSIVITLNYDTLVERCATSIGPQGGPYLHSEDIYPIMLTESRRRNAMILGSGGRNTFSFLKLHGSINWHYSGADTYAGETIFYTYLSGWSEAGDVEERESLAAVSDKVPLIVPPTTEKVTYFQHESVRRIWELAGDALRNANRVFVIGYSLPETDLSMRFLLNESRPGVVDVPLFVVNPDRGSYERYEKFLGTSYALRDQYVGADGLGRLVDELPERFVPDRG